MGVLAEAESRECLGDPYLYGPLHEIIVDGALGHFFVVLDGLVVV